MHMRFSKKSVPALVTPRPPRENSPLHARAHQAENNITTGEHTSSSMGAKCARDGSAGDINVK